jgi:hypothetical protein
MYLDRRVPGDADGCINYPNLSESKSKINATMNDPVVPKSAFKEDVRGKFAGTENAYLLPHHVEEVNRLQRQHAFIATHTGGKLTHAELPKGASILDVGCSDGE